jgi:hypothetical protein
MWDNEGTRLLREVILPRLDAHEAELRELRQTTWPVCQALLDSNHSVKNSLPFRNIPEKRKFLRFLDIDEIRKLMGLKAKWARIDDVSLNEELRMILVV